MLIPAVGDSRLYALPSVLTFGPNWWLEAVEYPTDFYPRIYAPYQEVTQPGLGVPAAPAVAAVGSWGCSTAPIFIG